MATSKFPVAEFTEADATAERNVLGAMILSGAVADKTLTMLREEAFFVPAHRAIFRSIQALRRRGIDPSLLSVRESCADSGLSKEALAKLLIQMADGIDTAKNGPFWAEKVSLAWRIREVMTRSSDIASAAKGGDWSGVVDKAMRLMHGLHEPATYEFAAFELLTMMRERPVSAVKSSLGCVNRTLASVEGYPKGDLSIIGGFSGIGKTMLMCQEIGFAALEGKRVLVVSLEMASVELMDRIARQVSGYWDADNAARHGEVASLAYEAMLKDVELGWDCTFYDDSNMDDGGAGLNDILSWIRGKHESSPVDIVFIDYAQLVNSPLPGKDWAKQADVARKLKGLAKRLGIAVVALAQVKMNEATREVEIAGSSEYYKAAALVLVLRKLKEDGLEKLYLTCAKVRSGARRWRQEVVIDAGTLRVVEVDDYPDQQAVGS